MAWSARDIPAQAGKLAIVTGAGGLGFETGLELARAGAAVVFAGRNDAKGRDAVGAVKAQVPAAQVSFEMLDLAQLSSVADFAARFAGAHQRLDLLINNAGVMALPERRATADGFELQFGTNHLGHFALTGRLLPLLRATPGARVVNVASLAHRRGRMRFDDPQWERGYHPWASYCQSKLANLLFTFAFARRSAAGGWGVLAAGAHPGYARTELIPNGPGRKMLLAMLLEPAMSHSAAAGALPTLMAATAADVRAGDYFGPSGLYELRGPPKRALVAPQAKDEAAQAQLWRISEALTGVEFGA